MNPHGCKAPPGCQPRCDCPKNGTHYDPLQEACVEKDKCTMCPRGTHFNPCGHAGHLCNTCDNFNEKNCTRPHPTRPPRTTEAILEGDDRTTPAPRTRPPRPECVPTCDCPNARDGKRQVFDADKKRCVVPDQCDAEEEPKSQELGGKPIKCPKGLVMDKCPRVLCLRCDQAPGCGKDRKLKKCEAKCVCPKGMVFGPGKTKGYPCIPLDKCPKKPSPKPKPTKKPKEE